jgi:glycosyltransferase involved in cell wall biosynthesis
MRSDPHGSPFSDEGNHFVTTDNARVAVLLPCYNESLTIGKVVQDFRRELPQAEIWVYDNNSTDGSAELARAAGANVRRVTRQGKGHVVRRMFQEVDADCYLMADSDDTYPAEAARELIAPVLAGEADMVNGDRLSSTYATENKRRFHSFGNWLVCTLIRRLFHYDIADVMTGYRAFSWRFAKHCPVLSSGFEIETEMTIFALDKRMAIKEIPIAYRDRPKGSFSKLNTFADGFRIIRTIFTLLRNYRPLFFFGSIAAILFLTAAVLAAPIIVVFLRIGLVPRFPTFIFACTLAICGALSIVCGLILESTKRYGDQLFEILLAQRRQ